MRDRKPVRGTNEKTYGRFLRAIPTAKITVRPVGHVSSYDWATSYDIPDVMLPNNGQRSVSKIFKSFRTYLIVKKLTTTPLHLQSDEKVDLDGKTLVSQLRLYIGDNQQSWSIF